MSGELKKLKIEAFRSIELSEGDKVGEFSVLFNPTSYVSKYEIEYGEGQGQGTSGTSQRFGRIKPQDYTFELLFDGTGAASEPREVHTDIDQFLTLTGKHDGEIHRPLYLRLSWGPLIVSCVLKSAEITYSLFKPDGNPLRAKVTAVFSEAIEDTLRAASEGNNSPDMTHERVVHGGDSLPLMVHRIYGSTAHTVDVARFNGLRHLRDLRPGQVLRLPPLVRPS
ncbi:MAG: hypothetical protein JXB05_32980 [Myxococcaceae bacterium]|nr:hypothetical protein [Myxococcaceae bacterium]